MFNSYYAPPPNSECDSSVLHQIKGCGSTPTMLYARCNVVTLCRILRYCSLHITANDFQYNVTVLPGKNMELRIQLNGNPIPEAIRVRLLYIDKETNQDLPLPTDGSYTNLRHIYIFLPFTAIPFTMFKIRVALGTDANSGPYKAPIRDDVIGE